MKNTTHIKQNRIKAQKGMALFTVLAVFLIVMLLGNLTFMSIHLDLKHTDRELKKGLRDYAGDAALHWGLFLTQNSEFYCATHDSTGNNSVDTSINCESSTVSFP
jgi:Tfp pilus assembly protein PilX